MRCGTSFDTFSAILYEARKKKYPNREAAAERLPVCSRLLDDYETGKGIPSPDMALAMSEELGSPFLRRVYCASICPIGRKQQCSADKPEDLARIALTLIKELQDVVNRQQSFISISFDGLVHEQEKGEYMEFLQELRELKQAVEVLELWTEIELETKKEAACAAR